MANDEKRLLKKLLIQGGRVIDPANGLDDVMDVLLIDGKVAGVGPGVGNDIDSSGGPSFDASDCIVTPGLIDPQVHFREPGQEDKETIATGAAAAVAGGFTSVVCMANTNPTIDDDTRVEFVYRQAERAAMCNVFPTGAVTKGRQGEELAEIALMSEAGAVAFTDDGDAIGNAAVMAKALTYVKMTGKPLFQHCEEPSLVSSGVMNAGEVATRLGLGGRPAVAEALTIQRDIMLNRNIGCRYHVQHISTAMGVQLVREARADGQPVTTEVSAHHLLLTEEACTGYDTNTKMNPPLRTQADIDAILDGIRDGTVTMLATDHAPHTREEKELEFAAAPAGILGLDCTLPLYIRALILPGVIDWPAFIAMMTSAPAALCNLDQPSMGMKGQLSVGGDADVTIIDPNLNYTIDVNAFASKARNCPFDGWDVQGRAIGTIVGGEIKMCRAADRLRDVALAETCLT